MAGVYVLHRRYKYSEEEQNRSIIPDASQKTHCSAFEWLNKVKVHPDAPAYRKLCSHLKQLLHEASPCFISILSININISFARAELRQTCGRIHVRRERRRVVRHRFWWLYSIMSTRAGYAVVESRVARIVSGGQRV